MQTFIQDFRYAVRLLVKNPAFTLIAVLTLALGITATTAIFTLVDAALLRPLPYAEPSRLVAVFDSRRQDVVSRFESSYPDFLDWRQQTTAFSALAGYSQSDSVLTTHGNSELVPGARVTSNFFSTLGVQPMLGRNFRDGEDLASSEKVVLLSYASFQRRFGGRREIVGQTFNINNKPTTIIGVLPKDFAFAPAGPAEMWRPLAAEGALLERRNLHWLQVVGRLKPEASLAGASADMQVITNRLEQTYPQSNKSLRAVLIPLSEIIVGDVRPILRILFAAVELLLLIGCANVANLLLSRSLVRQREIAIRTALGASRVRLVRQVLTEGILLACVAGGVGIAFAAAILRVLPGLVDEQTLGRMPFLNHLGVSAHMVLFVAASSLFAGVLFSLIPALQTSKPEVQQTLKQGTQMTASHAWRRLTSSFVVSEMAMALVLLVGAALLVKTLHRLVSVDLGFNSEHLVTLNVSLSRSYDTDEKQRAVHEKLMAAVRAVPGVESVGTTSVLPLNGSNTVNSRVVGDPAIDQGHEANIRDVSLDYFTALNARLARGRWFNEGDNATAPQRVIVNQRFVDLFLNGRDPLLHEIIFTFSPTQKPRQIVGVVENVREGSLDSEFAPAVYDPFAQSPDTDYSLAIRVSGSEEAAFSAVQKTIHAVEPGAVIYGVRTMQELIDISPAATLHRYAAWLASAFAISALLLGVIGLYSVISHSVTQRTQEIGVRMALGAQREDVLRMILLQGSRLILIGAGVGLIASLLAGRLLQGFLFAVRSWDPVAFSSAVLLLALVAVAASCIPAWRATRVSPMKALRYE